MRKISDSIVKYRYIILGIFICLSFLCCYLSTKVNINNDIMKYLPDSSETKIGKDIMEDNFDEIKSSTLNVMFKDLSSSKREEVLDELNHIDGVESIDYNNTDEYNKDNYTLFVINVDDYSDSSVAKDVYNDVKKLKPVAMSGSIYDKNNPVLHFSIVVLAVSIAMVILVILSDSFVKPFLYLIAIGIAIIINKGTNIMFSDVSNITDSITAILQLALSMDYSIMLSNRFSQEKEKEKNKVKAMQNALYDSFRSISSSSITTIVGLLALVFMSFTIGRDLGFVLAKGVLLSLISIFFCLPSLLLLFDKIIEKTKKKSFNLNLNKVANYSYITKYVQLIVFIIVFFIVFLLKGNLNILYTASEQDEVGKIFPPTNQIAIVYKNEYESLIEAYCSSLEGNDSIEESLCYSNTINQKKAYDELNKKFEDLGQSVELDDYLIKLIYYNYYNKDVNNKMTFDEFVNFIKSDIYSNDDLSSNIDDDTRSNIDLLDNFIGSNIEKKRSIEEIANILNVNYSDVEKILIFYNSKNNNSKLSIKEFINFMENDVLNDPSYGSEVDDSTKVALNKLKVFTNKNEFNKKITSNEMVLFVNSVIGNNVMSNDMMNQIYLYYVVKGNNDVSLTLNQFAKFSLLLASDSSYSNQFDNDSISSLKDLDKFSSSLVLEKMTYKEMASFLSDYGINETMTKFVYDYYVINSVIEIPDTTIEEFVDILNREDVQEIIHDENIENAINDLNQVIEQVANDSKVDADTMKDSFIVDFIGIEDSTIDEIYNIAGVDSLNIIEFINIAIDSNIISDEEINNKLNEVNEIIDSYINDSDLTPEQISNILNVKNEIIEDIIEINEKNNEELLLSPYEFVNFLLEDNNASIIDSIMSDKLDLLILADSIMSNKDRYFKYSDMCNYMESISNISCSSIKNIYDIYYYKNNDIKISPYELVEFLLINKDDSLLKEEISKYFYELNIASKVMNSTLNNKLYNYKDMSNLLNVDSNSLSLIYSLYNHKYEKNSESISLYEFINFTIDNVMNDRKYSSNFNDDIKDKLIVVKGIMNSSLNNISYNYNELYSILNKISDVDSNLIELVYIYNGSVNNYDISWKMTVEEFINFVYNDMLDDPRFIDFIDEDMKNKVVDGYEKISDAHKLLVSDKYSRVILNTKYGYEDEDTFDFISDIKDYIGDNEGIYVIGDSPMAYELSKSFTDELDFITVLTMLFIFIVVAFTFKSIIVSSILVLIIQCAVYVTMFIISLFGGNVYFIALLIVQAILMGATIDYAIVYTSYYKESRLTMNVKDSIKNAYNKSIHTILCSSSILILVTLVVANFATAIAAKICETISQGTVVSVLLILFVLPGVLSAFDRFICRKGYFKE